MEKKPVHFDGSGQLNVKEESDIKPLEVTDDMRKNLGGNPFRNE